ncbi:hypothetical protein [Winogradskyella sp.]|uniref:hypothetical protein n=2 Tax=Winogradskyella sp. TaxID=1883156 RepID=UPI003516AD68
MKFKIVILALLLTFSCSSNDNNNENSNSCEFDIPFVVQGNKWTSNVTTFGFDGGQIENEVMACGDNGLEVVITGPTGSITNIWKQEDGYLWTNANNAVEGFNRFYKINAEVGDVFTYNNNEGALYTTEVIAVDSTITVPAGTFICDVYKKTSTNVINETFTMWNHDVGQVKSDSGFTVFELASYNFD